MYVRLVKKPNQFWKYGSPIITISYKVTGPVCVCTINSISLFVVLWIEWNEPQTPKRLENQEARSLVKKTAFFLRLLQKNRSILVQPTGFILDCCPISFVECYYVLFFGLWHYPKVIWSRFALALFWITTSLKLTLDE